MIKKKEVLYKDKLIQWSYQYLYENRGKFSQDNKIKIALALAQKDIATRVEVGDGGGNTVNLIGFFMMKGVTNAKGNEGSQSIQGAAPGRLLERERSEDSAETNRPELGDREETE